LGVKKDPALTVTFCNAISSIDIFYNKENGLWYIAEKNRYVANCNANPVLYFSTQKNRCESDLNLFYSGKSPMR